MTCLNNFLVLSKETCQVTSKPSYNTTQITHTSLNIPLHFLQVLCWHYGKNWFMIAKFTKTRKCKPVVTTDAALNQHYESKGQRCFSKSKEREPVQPITLPKGQLYAATDSGGKNTPYFFSSTTHPSR